MHEANLKKIIRHMPEVSAYNASLDALSERWNLLTLLGQMSNIGMDMSQTREAFGQLTEQLLVKLGQERLKKLTSEMKSKAQVAVDIVIRNLFERTADIGFLATDEDIRDFLRLLKQSNPDDDDLKTQIDAKRRALVKRFEEYVLKYSVYNNIVLFDPNGQILAQLDPKTKAITSDCPFIKEALTTSREYVEYYGPCELAPDVAKSLVYAYRVTQSNQGDSKTLGVLALFFTFEEEMSTIFSNLIDEEESLEVLLLDKQGRVIASSDPYHIPIGAPMQTVLDREFGWVKFAGREYLCKTSKTNGYQGFFGLDWMGHVMVPVEHAFALTSAENVTLKSDILSAVMQNAKLFGDALISIPAEAEKIQRDLDITVWNGNVQIANTKTGDNSFSKSLLHEISKTGLRTKQIFEESIGNLNNTVISSILNDITFLAQLAIDIMDRNLYERANDARWWALTTQFRKELSNGRDAQKLHDILHYINNLYTVYTNLFVYDTHGVILAVSAPSQKHLVGSKLSASWVGQTLALRHSQHYVVSEFEKSPLYEGKHTYIYNAAITDLANPTQVLGGIGVVFDAAPQFHDMLIDTLPKDANGDIVENYTALFCTPDKTIIASSSPEFIVGAKLEIDTTFFNVRNAKHFADIIAYKHHYYAASAYASKGYREYKVDDAYTNDVIAIILVQIASLEHKRIEPTTKARIEYTYAKPQGNEPTTDISTFYIGDAIYGIESRYIITSLSHQPITRIIGSNDFFIGVVNYYDSTIGVATLHNFISDKSFTYDHRRHGIIVLAYPSEKEPVYFGIAIDQVNDSPEIPNRTIEHYNSSMSGPNTLTKAVVKPEKNSAKSTMLSILDIEAIYRKMVSQPSVNVAPTSPKMLTPKGH